MRQLTIGILGSDDLQAAALDAGVLAFAAELQIALLADGLRGGGNPEPLDPASPESARPWGYSLVIDGIAGLGGAGALREKAARIVRVAAKNHARFLAIDVPSGVAADTGAVEPGASIADPQWEPGDPDEPSPRTLDLPGHVTADVTVTFGGLRFAHALSDQCGEVVVADIALDGDSPELYLLPKEKWPDAISFQNEFNDVSPQTARCFIDMYDTLRKGGYEGLIVFGSYGPGGPTDSKEWERPHVKEACLKADAIETHEYWDLTVKHYDTWLAHRHVRAMKDYPWLRAKPWFIGEFGSDGVNKGEDPQKRSGWRDRDKLTSDEYIKQIEIYRYGDPKNEVVAAAENVMAVFLFQQGAPPHMWQGWETRGTKVMDYMKSTWKPTHACITGKVADSGGEPIAGLQISISPSDKKATTDAKGIYWLFALRPGDYALKATKTGFKPGSVKLSLKPGDLCKADLALRSSQP